MRASLARASRSALVELISLAIPLLLVINLPGGAESRARLLTHINRWHKVACIPENLKDTDHYICDYEGHVLCLPGWSDEMNACTTPLCQPQCSQNGNCSRPNTCECEVGWAGADCSKCVCLPGCVNGDCNLPFECLCRDGWEGMLCNKPTCKEGCDHGTCSMPGECICNPGWSGENCDVCTTLPGCSPENGYCNKPMQCRCKPGYTGQFCKEPICRDGCSEVNGWCEKPGECWCRVGWDGPTCTDCVKYPGCVNGGCEEPWECNCANGWGGMHCNQPHNTTNFPYPTSANNLRASPRGAQESTGNANLNGFFVPVGNEINDNPLQKRDIVAADLTPASQDPLVIQGDPDDPSPSSTSNQNISIESADPDNQLSTESGDVSDLSNPGPSDPTTPSDDYVH